jgi:hypothetical protein
MRNLDGHSPKYILITTTALLSILNGVLYLIFPNFIAGILNIIPDGYGVLITRYYGACALGYGSLLWLLRNTESKSVARAVLLSILILLGISTVIGIFGLIEGVTNQFGVLFVLTDLILSLGSLYFLLKERGV